MQNPLSSRRSPMSTPPNAASSKSKSTTTTPRRSETNSPTDDTPQALPYALASPKVRQNVPLVTVKLATPPSTPSRPALARQGASSSDQTNRTSATTEYFTPVSPNRSSIPPPLPPRPQSGIDKYGVKLVTPSPEYGTPLTSSEATGATFGSINDADEEARGPGAVLVTPEFKTPPVSPRTGAAELGYNVRPGSTGPYGDGLGLGLPSLGRAARGSVGPRVGKSSGGFGNAGFKGNGGDDPLGLGNARVKEEPAVRPEQHQRRPSERPLMEGLHSDSDVDGIIIDRRGPRPLRDVFFNTNDEPQHVRDEAMERNKRLIDTIGPFIYAFGMLERPKGKTSSSRSQSRANSTDLNGKDTPGQEGAPLRPPSVPLFKRLSSGGSWFSARSTDPESRTVSQSTGQTLVNPPAFGFSAQVLRTHTVSNEPSAVGPTDIREVQDGETLWNALHSLPREDLDRYQPLINLSTLFKGRTVPAIDFLTTKLALLSALIEESRSGSGEIRGGVPASTAFVTFRDPRDARRALKELAAHPNNALACVTTPAPDVRDIDWGRAMKSTYTGEFLKDWVVNVGVWGFTLLWVFPVTLFVGLVSIDNLSQFIPGLTGYLDSHRVQKELLSSFLPTLLVALLAILIPLLLLLIAKKAHNIITFSKLHDRILTRYYKFLVCK
ncbi:hypothetical protein FRC07_011960 [Ceratobasidium sp. 392]|nr:hypothetical protein FRC07_011960 [Ceratobasidium sp. 392]